MALLSLVLALGVLGDLPSASIPAGGVVDVHLHLDAPTSGAAMDALASAGVAWGLNLSGGWPGDGLEESLAAAREDGRLWTAVNVPWALARRRSDFPIVAARLIQEGAQLGARALKIEKALGLAVRDPEGKLVAVDDPWLDPLWTAAGRAGLPVFIHVGDPRAFWLPLDRANPRYAELSVHPRWSLADRRVPSFEALGAALLRVVARHPGTTFVSVHFGNCAEDVGFVARAMAAHPNLWIDLAARLPELANTEPAALRAMMLRFADRIVFGTDTGLGGGPTIMLGSTGDVPDTERELVAYFERHYRWLTEQGSVIASPTPIQGQLPLVGLGLPPDVVHAITRGNAERLLGVPPGAQSRAPRSRARFWLDALRSAH